MKRKSSPDKTEHRNLRAVRESLDALEEHGWSMSAMAQLLWLCGEMENGAVVDAKTVSQVGFLLTRELKHMDGALERLRKEIGRRK